MIVLLMVFILLASNTMIEKKIVKSKIAILLLSIVPHMTAVFSFSLMTIRSGRFLNWFPLLCILAAMLGLVGSMRYLTATRSRGNGQVLIICSIVFVVILQMMVYMPVAVVLLGHLQN